MSIAVKTQNLGVFQADHSKIIESVGTSRQGRRQVGEYLFLCDPKDFKFPFSGHNKQVYYCVSKSPTISPFLISIGLAIPKSSWQAGPELSMHERLRSVDGICHPRHIEVGVSRVYMVFDLCDGGDLCEFIRQIQKKSPASSFQSPPPWAIDWICYSIADILTKCHEQEVICRDLKTENFLLNKNDQTFVKVELTDLGMLVYKPELTESESVRICGSWPCFPPETYVQVRQNAQAPKADYSTDLWQLGIILFEIFCGGSYLNQAEVEKFMEGGPFPKFRDYSAYNLGRYGDEIKDLLNLNPEKRPPVAWVAKRIADIFLRTFPDSPVSQIVRNRPKLTLDQIVAILKEMKTSLGEGIRLKIASYLPATAFGIDSSLRLDTVLIRLQLAMKAKQEIKA